MRPQRRVPDKELDKIKPFGMSVAQRRRLRKHAKALYVERYAGTIHHWTFTVACGAHYIAKFKQPLRTYTLDSLHSVGVVAVSSDTKHAKNTIRNGKLRAKFAIAMKLLGWYPTKEPADPEKMTFRIWKHDPKKQVVKPFATKQRKKRKRK